MSFADNRRCAEGCEYCNPETSWCTFFDVLIKPYEVCIDETAVIETKLRTN